MNFEYRIEYLTRFFTYKAGYIPLICIYRNRQKEKTPDDVFIILFN